MRKLITLGIAAVMASAIVSPAAAQYNRAPGPFGGSWDHLGTVDFGNRVESERVWGNFGGAAERIRLTADRNGVACRSVTATFGNGRSRNIFSGNLREDRPSVIDLPGNERSVRNISFRCRSLGRGPAVVSIAADISPRDRRGWRDHSYFGRLPGFGRDLVFNIGTERFGPRSERETVMTRFGGQRIQAIGLRAVDGNASCRRVVARFANGGREVLTARRPISLHRGRTHWLDLPGNVRNVQSLALVCEAEGRARNVTIEVLAERDLPGFASGYGR